MQFHSEGGLELLSRFSEKSCSINVDEFLFPGAVDGRSVIEIAGAPSTGKSLLLYRFVVRCILPARHKEIEIGGCDGAAILIDTLGHVQVRRVAELATAAIRRACEAAGARLPDERIDLIASKSLGNLTIIGCCSNTQFQLALHTLEEELLGNGRTTLLAIDGILAYYWSERREKSANFTMDWYARSLIRLIRAKTSQFNIVTAYTRWDKCASEHEAPARHSNPLEQTGVDYRLQLCASDVPRKFIAHVQSTSETKQVQYTISDSGVEWIVEQS